MAEVSIIDATLREGMQSESGTFDISQSIEIAELLEDSGVVDTIECGHPQISRIEYERVSAVVKAAGNLPVLTHARLKRSDIERAADTGAEWVGVFVGCNSFSNNFRTGWLEQSTLLRQVEEVLPTAIECGLKVRFSIEDATRTDWSTIERVVEVALEYGARRICLADSVGIAEPEQIGDLFGRFSSRFPGVDLEAHLHDDRGLSMANALRAIDSGASYVSTSVNSLGERSGITDLAAFVVNQHLRGALRLPKPGVLANLSRLVGAYSRSLPDDRRAVVGSNAYRHTARLHTRAVEREPKTYEILSPECLGLERKLGPNQVSREIDDLIVTPPIISATELRYHRHGPGDRYLLVDDRLVPGAKQYCIARKIPDGSHSAAGHVDTHVHFCDSLFVFLGDGPGYSGLTAEVQIGDKTRMVHSPTSVFIPAGERHRYRVVSGSGTYINHVLAGDYNSSLL